MTSTGVIKAQQQENPNFPHRLPYPPCDQLILRRAGLDEVKPAKYLCEFRGRMALLDHSSLSNLILHFAVRVPLCPWCGRVCHTDPLLQGLHNIKVLSRLIQGSICPGDQSCCHGTDLHSHPQPVCQGDAQNSEVTVSDTNQSYSTFSPHNRHELQMAASGPVWNLHLQKAKCPTGSQHSWAQAFPRWQSWISTLSRVAAGAATYRGSRQANSWHSSVSWLSREARSSPLTLK